jgi:site-specific recombinase XerD
VRVQRAIIRENQNTIWLVLDDNFLPIKPIQDYLTYLNNIERSPNTVRAYAYHLKLFWEFLTVKKLTWTSVRLHEMAEFLHWLRDPQPRGVTAIHERIAKRTEKSINTILTAIAMFYDYYERLGVIQGNSLYKQTPPLYGQYKNFLHGIAKTKPIRGKIVKLKVPRMIPQVIAKDKVEQLIDSCNSLRDKFLVSLLYETGMRIGQALGLRHKDINSRECVIYIVTRKDNSNGVRAKTTESYPIHVSRNLMRLYANYLVDEVQDNISDYVFINLWRKPIGKPMTAAAVADLFRRLSKKVAIAIHPHLLRHTHATELIRNGWDPSYVQRRLGHASIQTTINTYVHLSADDLKKAYAEYQSKKDHKL